MAAYAAERAEGAAEEEAPRATDITLFWGVLSILAANQGSLISLPNSKAKEADRPGTGFEAPKPSLISARKLQKRLKKEGCLWLQVSFYSVNKCRTFLQEGLNLRVLSSWSL